MVGCAAVALSEEMRAPLEQKLSRWPRKPAIDKGRKSGQLLSNQKAHLASSAVIFGEPADLSRSIVPTNDEKMRARNGEHVLNRPVDVIIAKAVAVRDQHAMRTAESGRHVTKQICIWVKGRLDIFGRVGVDQRA